MPKRSKQKTRSAKPRQSTTTDLTTNNAETQAPVVENQEVEETSIEEPAGPVVDNGKLEEEVLEENHQEMVLSDSARNAQILELTVNLEEQKKQSVLLEEEIERLKTEMKEQEVQLLSQNESSQDQINTLIRKLKNSVERVKVLEEQKVLLKEEHEQEVQNLRSEAEAQMQDSIKTHDEEVLQLKQKLDSVEQQLQDSETGIAEKLEMSGQQIQTLKEQLEAAQRRNAEIEESSKEQVLSLEEKIQILQKQNTELDQDHQQEMQNLKEQLQIEKSHNIESQDSFKEQVLSLEQKIQILQQQKTEFERDQQQEIQNLKEQLQIEKTHNTESQDSFKEQALSLEGKIQVLQQQKTELEQNHQREIQKLAFESEDQAQTSAKLHQQELRQLTENLHSLEQEIEISKTGSSEELNKAKQEFEILKDAHQKEIQEALEKEKSIRHKLHAAIKKGKAIEEEKLKLEQDQNSELQILRSAFDSQLTQTAQLHEEEIDECNKKLASMQQTLDSALKTASEEKVSSKQEIQNLLDQIKDQKSQIESNEALNAEKVKNSTNRIEVLDQETTKLQQEVQELGIKLQQDHEEATEREKTIKQKLQAAIKKGMKIDQEKNSLDQDLQEISKKASSLLNKLPDFSSLESELQENRTLISTIESQFLIACGKLENSEFTIQELQDQNQILFNQVKEQENRIIDLTQDLELANAAISELEDFKEAKEKQITELEKTASKNDSKLIRAREAIEALRKSKTELTEQQNTLIKDLEASQDQNKQLLIQLESKMLDPVHEKDLLEAKAQISTLQSNQADLETREQYFEEERIRLEDQMKVLEDEKANWSIEQEMVLNVYSAASNFAQALNLPFSELDEPTSQLQTVCLMLEGAQVGIEKHQEQLSHLSEVLVELEDSKNTVQRLEEELLKLRKESSTPASSYSATMELTPPGPGSFTQTKTVKRRDPQDPAENGSFMVDLGLEEEAHDESKQMDYTPLISMQALRSAPPPVLHMVKSLDQQTQGFGKILGHRPGLRIGIITYALVLHLVLVLLLV